MLAAPHPSEAAPRPLTSEEKKVVGRRLARAVKYKPRLSVAEGDTVFVVRRVRVPNKKVRGDAVDYEGLVTSVQGLDGLPAPRGIVIDERIDQVTFKVARRERLDITFRYAVTVMPGTRRGGTVKFKLKLIDRKGLGESVLTIPLKHKIKIKRPKPSDVDLTADFYGYRIYIKLARKRGEELAAQGIKGLNLRQDGRLPPLLGTRAKVVKQALEFDKWRRRAWVAYRHLAVATRSRNRRTAALAQKYIKLLNEPDERLTGLPHIPLARGAPPILGGSAAPAGGDEPVVETLKPTAREPAPSTPPPANDSGTLQPLGPSTPRTAPEPVPPPKRVVTDPPKTTPVKPDPSAPVIVEEEIDSSVVGRKKAIPSHPRFLTLDDPNIGYGGAVRISYAKISTQETATAPAAFFSAQLALTPDFGFEVTVPAALVNLDVARAQTLTTVGNPLIAAKYRLHLPEVLDRRPSVTVRARWAVPLSPLSTVPPTNLGAEEFSLPAHFADTYAFLLEKNGLGLGVATSWELSIVHAGAQVYLDYFSAVGGSRQDQSFFAVGYGASIGVRPFGDVIGAYVETRGAQLMVGPRRNELFTYAGLRGRILDVVEPALWVSLPLGSVGDVSTLQYGAELRLVYDVDSIVVRGSGRRSDQFSFE